MLSPYAVSVMATQFRTCKPGCLSLGLLAGLAGLDSTCLCITDTILEVQHSLQQTQRVGAARQAAGLTGERATVVSQAGCAEVQKEAVVADGTPCS